MAAPLLGDAPLSSDGDSIAATLPHTERAAFSSSALPVWPAESQKKKKSGAVSLRQDLLSPSFSAHAIPTAPASAHAVAKAASGAERQKMAHPPRLSRSVERTVFHEGRHTPHPAEEKTDPNACRASLTLTAPPPPPPGTAAPLPSSQEQRAAPPSATAVSITESGISTASTSFKAENPNLPEDHYLHQAVASFVHPKLRRSLTEVLHIERLTRIQRLCWEGMCRRDADVIIRSETGSGKTLAYALPLLHQLLLSCDTHPVQRDRCGTLLLVMCPTRELVVQVTQTLTDVLRHALFLTVGGIYGGESRHKEKARLRKGLPVLVATPGRMLDHLQSTSSWVVSGLQALVMDEADRLLDMGFEKALLQIMELLKEKMHGAASAASAGLNSSTGSPLLPHRLDEVKRVLVSATITDGVERLSHFTLRPPTLRFGETEDLFTIPPTLRQQYACVPTKHRLSALLSFLRSQVDAGAKKMVIFVSTADGTEFLYYLVSRLMDPFRRGGSAAYEGVRGVLPKKKTSSSTLSVRRMTALANQHLHRRSDEESEDEDERERGLDKVITFEETTSEEDMEEEGEMRDLDGGETGNGTSNGGGRGSGAARAMGERHGRAVRGGKSYFLDVDVFKLHGNMSQVDRAAVFHSFRYGTTGGKKNNHHIVGDPSSPPSTSSRCAILFCTDVAARGLDMPDIHWIVHYDPPVSAPSYVHRIGRTARIGRSGDSMLFLAPHEEGFAAYLSHFLTQKNPTSSLTTPSTSLSPFPTSSSTSPSAMAKTTAVGCAEMLVKKAPYETLLYYLTKLDGDPRNNTIFTSAATLERAMVKLVMRENNSEGGGWWGSVHHRRPHNAGSSRNADGSGDTGFDEEGGVDGPASESERERENLCRLALFGYQSYLRAYAAIPKEIRYQFFDSRLLHLGHVAQSFGLDKSPAEVQQQLRRFIQQDHALARNPKAMTTTGRGGSSHSGPISDESASMRRMNDVVEEESEWKGEGDTGDIAVPLIGTKGHNKQKLIRVAVEHEDRYHSTMVQKQRKRTRDWVESKQAESGKNRVKPLKFTEFDA